MSYIGNQVTSVPHTVDAFAGDGSTTSFGPLTRAPAGTAAIAVFLNGVYQTPGAAYTLNGDYIVFVTAPINLATIVVHHLGNGTTTQVPSDGSVTGTKLAINSIRANNIVAGEIKGNLIGTGAISANNFAGGGITSNVLASNLNISVSRTLETATVNSTAIGGTGNVNFDVVNNTVYLFTTAATANMQFNIRANTTH